MVFAGPIASGSILLLLPSRGGLAQDLPDSYRPLHKGHIDLSTGLYIRENEDLMVRGTPPLILRRTYISRFRESKQFGVGAMHNGEWYVIGDGTRFQWAALVRPGQSRIAFERTSPGASLLNAMFEHRSSVGEWQGAKLGWTGLNWALRKADGSLMLFRACGPGPADGVCSVIHQRDAAGHVIHYRRDRAGRLLKIRGRGQSVDRVRLRRPRPDRARVRQHDARGSIRVRHGQPRFTCDHERRRFPLHLHRS